MPMVSDPRFDPSPSPETLFVICVLVTSTGSRLKADCTVTGPRIGMEIPLSPSSSEFFAFDFLGRAKSWPKARTSYQVSFASLAVSPDPNLPPSFLLGAVTEALCIVVLSVVGLHEDGLAGVQKAITHLALQTDVGDLAVAVVVGAGTI